MADLTFEEIVREAQKLTPEQQAALVHTLQPRVESVQKSPVTREQIIANRKAHLAAGAFDDQESLFGKFARPDLDVSKKELDEYLRQIGREWEEELDDLKPDN